MNLETITGDLRAYRRLEPGTFRHVDELAKEQLINHDLRNQTFYTADGNIYFTAGFGRPKLAMTREQDNLILNNLDDAFLQLLERGNYRVSQEDAERAIDAANTEIFDLLKLTLSGENSEWRYLSIGTSPEKYEQLAPEDCRLAERVYGKDQTFIDVMQFLVDKGVNETRVYVLAPDYVKEHASKDAVGRASWRINYSNDFNANGRNIYYSDRLRGVRCASEASQERRR